MYGLALDGFFADGELRRNLFVGIPLGKSDAGRALIRWGQRIIGGMLRKLNDTSGETVFFRHALPESFPAVPYANRFFSR